MLTKNLSQSNSNTFLAKFIISIFAIYTFTDLTINRAYAEETKLNKQANDNKEIIHSKQASIAGLVIDDENKTPLAEVKVVLSRLGDKEHERVDFETEFDGKFNFEKLEPGEYLITASAPGKFSRSEKIHLRSNEVKELKLSLENQETVDVLRVTGKRTLIHPEKIGSETNLDHKLIYQYKSGNDLRELINSTPGVMNDSYGNMITRGEHNAINYEIDGVVLPEAAGVLQQTQVISPRSLQTMAVDIGGYQASDGGGPLGAVAHMKSLPILAKPNFNIGQQFGGPLAGTTFYNASTAFSQNPASFWHKLRIESSGAFQGTSYKLAPPVKNYVNNRAVDINTFTKLEFMASKKDTFRITAALNQTISQIPTSASTRDARFHGSQTDGQHYIIASYIHKFDKIFDELNLHLLNGFYFEKFRTSIGFDPFPNFNADQALQSIAAKAKRFNYVFSAQGALSKTVNKEHHFKVGFLSEIRPVKTLYNAIYYNADLISSLQQASGNQQLIAETNQGIQDALAAEDFDTANALREELATISPNPFPWGAQVSPFTGQLGGPQFLGPVGRYRGFRYLQSAYFQDKYTPNHGFWKRLTLDAGVRFDLQRSVYGNSLPLASTIASIPGVQPFSLKPYMTQHLTNAQASGRYGATFVIAKNTVLRGSYSDIFTPTPVDYFLTPYDVTGSPVAGIFDGTPRPLPATRGRLVDTSVETQIGPRFSTRTNLFYKYLTNFGDSGVVGNLPLYNRLTNAAQNAYGVETRIDLKSNREGYGFNGFLSNTVQVAYLRGIKDISGGFYTSPGVPSAKFPDHDRRLSTVAGLGFKSRKNWWTLMSVQVQTGLQDSRDPLIYGPHPARTPVFTNISLSAGYQPRKDVLKKYAFLPSSFDLRIDNMLNQRVPVNLGSPFQGTRFSLPLRVLVGCSWQLGPEEAKLSSKKKTII